MFVKNRLFCKTLRIIEFLSKIEIDLQKAFLKVFVWLSQHQNIARELMGRIVASGTQIHFVLIFLFHAPLIFRFFKTQNFANKKIGNRKFDQNSFVKNIS